MLQMKGSIPAVSLVASLCVSAVVAQAPVEPLDHATISRIRDEGLTRSQVMDHIGWLSDVYGPRLTGGPGIMQASNWTIAKFNEWGLAHAHRETWPFGKGWSLIRFSAHLIEPQIQPLIGYPGSWTPGTPGTVTAEVVRVQIESEADFERYRGTLAGRIVLTQPERPVPDARRIDRASHGADKISRRQRQPRLGARRRAAAVAAPVAVPAIAAAPAGRGSPSLATRIAQFYKTEGVVAAFNRGSDSVMASVGSNLTTTQQRPDGGTIFPIGNGSRGADAGTGIPTVTLAVEHYNRMVRLLARSIPVKVELNIKTEFHDETAANGFNIVAEIPGADPKLKDEVVMLGAHFDSVAAGTGATDNAAGSAAMMEAMRILQAIGVKPRRTIRIALWGGEEEGLLGSRAYVREHFGDPATMVLKPDHAKLAAYFNSDNGTGRIRGIWLQENLAVRPIFEHWMKPLADLGVVAAGPRIVTATDHVAFDAVGLPGFQFMVDRLEYNSRTHHSNMDVYDRVQRDDMIQQATVIAVFAYNAAMRDERLPRKPLPTVAP